jgi:hypothetical protein
MDGLALGTDNVTEAAEEPARNHGMFSCASIGERTGKFTLAIVDSPTMQWGGGKRQTILWIGGVALWKEWAGGGEKLKRKN